MRYPKDHKHQARRKIVSVAAREFRRRGISALGVGDVMKGAGLTKGAFSGHFSSKEELVKEALHEAMITSPVFYDGHHGKTLTQMIDHYLGVGHRDDPQGGCPLPALIEEVARHPKQTRAGFVSDIEEIVSIIEAHLPKGRHSSEREDLAMAIFSMMLGAVQLARVARHHNLSKKVLEAARKAALRLAKA